jgi:hypothetical protein
MEIPMSSALLILLGDRDLSLPLEITENAAKPDRIRLVVIGVDQ